MESEDVCKTQLFVFCTLTKHNISLKIKVRLFYEFNFEFLLATKCILVRRCLFGGKILIITCTKITTPPHL